MSKQTAVAWLKDYLDEHFEDLYDATYEMLDQRHIQIDENYSAELTIGGGSIESVEYSVAIGRGTYEKQIGFKIPVEFTLPFSNVGDKENIYRDMFSQFGWIFANSDANAAKVQEAKDYKTDEEYDQEDRVYYLTIIPYVLVPATLGE